MMAVSLNNILINLLDNFAKILPFRIVHDYEQGVRFTFGHASKTIHGMKKGWWLFIPIIQRIEITDITWGQVLLDTQSIATSDNVNISVSGSLVYRVSDARSYLLSVYDSDAPATLRAIAKGCVASVIMKSTYEDIHNNKENIEMLIVEKLRQEVMDWGLNVHKLHLHDIVKAKNIHLHGLSQPPEEHWE